MGIVKYADIVEEVNYRKILANSFWGLWGKQEMGKKLLKGLKNPSIERLCNLICAGEGFLQHLDELLEEALNKKYGKNNLIKFVKSDEFMDKENLVHNFDDTIHNFIKKQKINNLDYSI